MHRVGLTRHCLSSGSVQLPFALRDALPAGELLALDVERDEPLLVDSRPPRRLAGLRPLFDAYELDVNDVLELRLAEGELRLACVRRARRRAPAREGDDAPADAAPHDAPAAGPARSDAARDRDRPTGGEAGVVERIGSVTVRRLGAGPRATRPASRPAPSPRPERPAPADGAPAAGALAPAPGDDAASAFDAPSAAPRGEEGPAGPLDPASRPAAPTRAEPPARPTASTPAATPDAPPLATWVEEDDLLDEVLLPPHDVLPETAPTPERPAIPAPATPDSTERPDERQRAREEELSRAGDLRSRIVRWLLDPGTPVIVPVERVQARFDLSPDVARDVVDGILDDPPPSLRLTVLREGLVRVARVTVEQEA